MLSFSGRRVVNETLESISIDLGFSGNTIAEGIHSFIFSVSLLIVSISFCLIFFFFFLILVDEGLVVSTCLGGAFIGSLFSGLVADGVGRRRAFQLSALPMIIGASVRLSVFLLLNHFLFRLLIICMMNVFSYKLEPTLTDLNMYVSTYLNIMQSGLQFIMSNNWLFLLTYLPSSPRLGGFSFIVFFNNEISVLTNVLVAVQQLRVLRACSWEGFLSELGWA